MDSKKGSFVDSDALIRETKFDYIGFSIYDVIHIAFAIAFLVLAYWHKAEGYEIESAECATELVFSLLLIVFIKELVEKPEKSTLRRFYTFAWVSASAALFLPETFSLPSLVNGLNGAREIFQLCCILSTAIAFFLFLAALFQSDTGRNWNLLMIVGIGFFFVSSPLLMAKSYFKGGETYEVVMAIIKNSAPLFPTGFSFYSFLKEFKNQSESIDQSEK